MISWRFLVTNVLILATAAFLAGHRKADKKTAQVDEGNRQIQTAFAARSDLDAKFNLLIGSKDAFDWNALSKADRQMAKEKLAEYVSAVTRTFEIDAKSGLYLTEKEILRQQLESAMGLQKSLESFERTYGENFDPKKPQDHA